MSGIVYPNEISYFKGVTGNGIKPNNGYVSGDNIKKIYLLSIFRHVSVIGISLNTTLLKDVGLGNFDDVDNTKGKDIDSKIKSTLKNILQMQRGLFNAINSQFSPDELKYTASILALVMLTCIYAQYTTDPTQLYKACTSMDQFKIFKEGLANNGINIKDVLLYFYNTGINQQTGNTSTELTTSTIKPGVDFEGFKIQTRNALAKCIVGKK